MSNTRAERRIWEKIPDGKWLTQDELRDVVDANPGHPMRIGLADAAIRWLLDLGYVRWRPALSFTPRRPGEPGPLEYARCPLGSIEFEVEVQRAADDLERQRVEAKTDRDTEIDRRVNERLRELGLIPNQLNEVTA